MTIQSIFCEMFVSCNFFLNFLIFTDNGLGIEWISELKYTKFSLMLNFSTKAKCPSKFQQTSYFVINTFVMQISFPEN